MLADPVAPVATLVSLTGQLPSEGCAEIVTSTLKVPGEVLSAAPDAEHAALAVAVTPLLSSKLFAVNSTCCLLPEGYATGADSFTSACDEGFADCDGGGKLAGREHATAPNNKATRRDSFSISVLHRSRIV